MRCSSKADSRCLWPGSAGGAQASDGLASFSLFELELRPLPSTSRPERAARKLLHSTSPTPCSGQTQRAQYPLNKEYGLNYIGLHIMI